MIPRVVFDTNIWIRYLLRRRGAIAWLIDVHWPARQYELLISLELLTELNDVLSRPALARYMPPHRRRELLLRIQSLAEMLEPVDNVPSVCPDPADDMFVAYALSGHADCIDTRDHDLLDLEQVGDVRILTPEEFQTSLPD